MSETLIQENLSRLAHYFKEFMEKAVITNPDTTLSVKRQWMKFKPLLVQDNINIDDVASYVDDLKPFHERISPIKINTLENNDLPPRSKTEYPKSESHLQKGKPNLFINLGNSNSEDVANQKKSEVGQPQSPVQEKFSNTQVLGTAKKLLKPMPHSKYSLKNLDYYVKNFINLFGKNSGILKTISEKTVDTKTPQISLQQRVFGSFTEGLQGNNKLGTPSKKNFNAYLPMVPIYEENSENLGVPSKGALKRVSVYTKKPNLAEKFQEFMKEELMTVQKKGKIIIE